MTELQSTSVLLLMSQLVISGLVDVKSGYLYGQYKRLRQFDAGVLTGKPLGFGGSLIRPEATGYGLVYYTEEMLKANGDSFTGKKVDLRFW